jgi:hypothetical protein
MNRKEVEDGVEGILVDRLRLFVALLQVVGRAVPQMTWTILVLLLKGGGNYPGIGLLDPIWKVVEKVMVAWFSVIKLHDCHHGGIPCRGMRMAIMEVIRSLNKIYLDLRKACDALDWWWCLEILAWYGVGLNLLCLQKKFWDDVKMVCRAGGNYVLPFEVHRGVTQGSMCVLTVS